jgi:UDP-2,4-diacetamido-2,4,6-trideoxy-beta-L-altropyranose hydrolase
MKVIFRADASLDLGTGHVMRCLTLAQALREYGAVCHFVCREQDGNLIDLIHQRGFEVQTLPMQHSSQQVPTDEPFLAHAAWLGVDWQTDAEQTKMALGDDVFDWMVVDHYALDARWEKQLRSSYRKLMVIDDLADRLHECNFLLDQNLGRISSDYSDLVPKNCQVLVGPQYALLRPEFFEMRQYSLTRRANATFKHLLISMGGVDKDNATGQVLAALKYCSLQADLRITVVMGPHAPWLANVRCKAKELSMPVEVLVGVDNMANLMAESDLAIGAAGSTSWERSCLGLPTLLVVLANNQLEGAEALVKTGSALLVGGIEDISTSLFQHLECIQNQGVMSNMQKACKEVSNEIGVISIAKLMVQNYV